MVHKPSTPHLPVVHVSIIHYSIQSTLAHLRVPGELLIDGIIVTAKLGAAEQANSRLQYCDKSTWGPCVEHLEAEAGSIVTLAKRCSVVRTPGEIAVER